MVCIVSEACRMCIIASSSNVILAPLMSTSLSFILRSITNNFSSTNQLHLPEIHVMTFFKKKFISCLDRYYSMNVGEACRQKKEGALSLKVWKPDCGTCHQKEYPTINSLVLSPEWHWVLGWRMFGIKFFLVIQISTSWV